ncbi:MAG: GNAT family N-acetyltransferase [DPANN group archaeon]|nr:GNAT family N-acetyltransferase [DPANN group archaeon]
MATVIIVHGTKGSPEGNWFPWLKEELEKSGCKVFVPKFPTPEGQNLDNWLKEFSKYKQHLDENSIVVGHSLGPAFLLSVIEQLNKPIKAAFFVAGFLGLLGNEEFDNLNKSFTTRNFDWDKIKKNCKKFYVINSDDDPYVPLQRGKELAKNLKAKLVVMKKSGHINQEFGFTKLPMLLDMIKQELKLSKKELKRIEKAHCRMQKGVFFSGSRKVAGATLLWSDKIIDSFWNYASFINAKPPEDLIKEAVEFYKSKNRKPAFYLTPWTKPKNFESVLQSHGFKLAYKDAWQVYNGKEITLPTNIDIREVKTKDDKRIFVEVFNKAFSGEDPNDPYGALPKEYGETVALTFGKKRWKNYLVYSNGKPVATGGIAIDKDCAGIYSIGTHPDFRKKGFGAAVVNFCTKKALENKCKYIFLQTVKDSSNERFYNKLGFETVFTGVCWNKD